MDNEGFLKIFDSNNVKIEITDAVVWEFEIFKLNEDARFFITVLGIQIPIEQVTFYQWLFWQTEDKLLEGITLENEDLIEAEFEIVC